MNPLASAVNRLSSAGAAVQFCAAELVFQGVGGEWNHARVYPADRHHYPRRSAVSLVPMPVGTELCSATHARDRALQGAVDPYSRSRHI
jgi:hypothetical protein